MATQRATTYEPTRVSGSAEERLGMHRDLTYGASPPTWGTRHGLGLDLPEWVLQVEQALEALRQALETLRDEVVSIRERLEEIPRVSVVHLYDLASPDYCLRAPISVVLEEYADEIIARLPEFDLYASGPSHAVAIANLKVEILSTYQQLMALGEERLGPLALQWLQTMNLIVERRGNVRA